MAEHVIGSCVAPLLDYEDAERQEFCGRPAVEEVTEPESGIICPMCEDHAREWAEDETERRTR